MLILNFAHPLTNEQLEQIERILGKSVREVRDIQTHFDNCQPVAPQTVALADACELSPHDWQTQPLLVVPPSLSTIAATLLAEIHGRAGYFPPIIRVCPGLDLPSRYVVSEIVNLQVVRDEARTRRN
ncbi:MAG: hypothetical protein HQK55_05535 [Deltaproteobacteria bacterium]|nr:hypothetical protein [Deltaproteobacteria bacterium]